VVINTTVARHDATYEQLQVQLFAVIASSAPNGSSISSTAGWSRSARARATRCCIPPESWWGRWQRSHAGSAGVSNSKGALPGLGRDCQVSSTASKTLSSTVRQASNTGPLKDKADLARGTLHHLPYPVARAGRRSISPDKANKVVFPQPLSCAPAATNSRRGPYSLTSSAPTYRLLARQNAY